LSCAKNNHSPLKKGMNKAQQLVLMPEDFLEEADGYRLTEKGFGKVAHQKRGDLKRYAEGLAGTHWADDIVQNVLIKLLRQEFKIASAGAVMVWMFRVAHNEAFDILRKQARLAPSEYIVDTPVMPEADRWETRQRIDRILSQLAPQEKACFHMIHQGYSYKEVGESLSVTEDYVAVIVCRARKKLVAQPI
jgi:RNA polymerase sigma factor (sigma-70 family)